MTKTAAKHKPLGEKARADWKGNAPNGGQWKQRSGPDQSKKTGFAVVSVKLRPAEKEELQRICKSLGVSPNWAMRSMARQAVGFLETGNETLIELRSITRQISGIATNINQIAKAGNRTLNPDYQAFMEDRKELGKELARLESQVQQILNVGKRRTDGLTRLKEAIAAS